MASRKIAIIGGSGDVGSHIVHALIKNPAFAVPPSSLTLLSRQSDRRRAVPAFCPPEVRLVTVPSYTDKDAMTAALQGQDVLISCLNTRVLDLEPAIVQLAAQAGVQRFIPSEFTEDCSHPSYLSGRNDPPLARQRVEWAKELHRIATEEGSIEYTAIIPGPFVDYCVEKAFWPFDIPKRKATLFDGGTLKKYGCSLRFTGQCVAAALKTFDATKNKRLRIAELPYTGQEILKALEQTTKATWEVEHKSIADLEKEQQAQMAKGDPVEAYMTSVIKMNFDKNAAGALEDGMQFCADKNGQVYVPRRTLQEVIESLARDD